MCTIKHAASHVQSHTVALDLYAVSIACGVLCMSQSIHSFGELAGFRDTALFNPKRDAMESLWVLDS